MGIALPDPHALRKPPAWGQVKALMKAAKEIVRKQGSLPTPVIMFLVMFVVISCQVLTVSGGTVNWAYVPQPPVLQLITWDSEPIPVFNNATEILGGMSSSFITHQSNTNFSFFGQSSGPPICFQLSSSVSLLGCLPISFKTVLTSSPVTPPPDKGHRRKICPLDLSCPWRP